MAYGTANVDVIQSSTAGTPPQFNDGNGTQTGTLCRAWVTYKGTSTQAIRASFNVSSVTYNSTGDYTVNFTTAMADTNYCVCGTSGAGATYQAVVVSPYAYATQTTSAMRFRTFGSASTLQDQDFISVAIFR